MPSSIVLWNIIYWFSDRDYSYMPNFNLRALNI